MLLAPGSSTPEAAAAESAVPAGLIWSTDAEPGIARVRKGTGFVYRNKAGHPIKDAGVIARINKLAIPPAYEDVWICASPRGHLQATGRDARGRKQYRYHEKWRSERDTGKFDRLLAFAEILPRLRKQVARDIAQPGHSRQVVLATLVRLLDTTLIRVGNDQYAKENKSFGLTTLRNRHARIEGDALKLSFRGKSGVQHQVTVRDRRVLRVVRRCMHLPGQELFQYRDNDGVTHCVGSSDVNDYLHAVCGERFTAKDFRTWHGSSLALETLRKRCGSPDGCFTLKEWLSAVAKNLGNTPAVCRKAYIHPDVLALGIASSGKRAARDEDGQALPPPKNRAGLSAAERRLVAFLGQSTAKT